MKNINCFKNSVKISVFNMTHRDSHVLNPMPSSAKNVIMI